MVNDSFLLRDLQFTGIRGWDVEAKPKTARKVSHNIQCDVYVVTAVTTKTMPTRLIYDNDHVINNVRVTLKALKEANLSPETVSMVFQRIRGKVKKDSCCVEWRLADLKDVVLRISKKQPTVKVLDPCAFRGTALATKSCSKRLCKFGDNHISVVNPNSKLPTAVKLEEHEWHLFEQHMYIDPRVLVNVINLFKSFEVLPLNINLKIDDVPASILSTEVEDGIITIKAALTFKPK